MRTQNKIWLTIYLLSFTLIAHLAVPEVRNIWLQWQTYVTLLSFTSVIFFFMFMYHRHEHRYFRNESKLLKSQRDKYMQRLYSETNRRNKQTIRSKRAYIHLQRQGRLINALRKKLTTELGGQEKLRVENMKLTEKVYKYENLELCYASFLQSLDEFAKEYLSRDNERRYRERETKLINTLKLYSK